MLITVSVGQVPPITLDVISKILSSSVWNGLGVVFSIATLVLGFLYRKVSKENKKLKKQSLLFDNYEIWNNFEISKKNIIVQINGYNQLYLYGDFPREIEYELHKLLMDIKHQYKLILSKDEINILDKYAAISSLSSGSKEKVSSDILNLCSMLQRNRKDT